MESRRSAGTILLLPSDQSILDSQEPRSDLSCRLKPINPELGFDLAFHAGFEVSLPFSEIVENGTRLTNIFRVIPENHPEEARYFRQKWLVPFLKTSSGSAMLRGEFLVAEGDYQVDWLLRDETGRFCAAFWRLSTELRGKDKQINFGSSFGDNRGSGERFISGTLNR